MNTPFAGVPFSVNLAPPARKKRVLLIDASSHMRDLRAEVMRKLGMDVDCAADIVEARCWWKADLYDLVLIDLHKGRGQRDEFCQDVRGAKPPQRLAFFVGGPGYLADVPSENENFALLDTNPQLLIGEAKAALSGNLTNRTQRWGILEASRRISEVRRACTARAQALRELPPLPRDPEGRASKRITSSTTLDDLLREEMQ
jgi:CheY-like chemotaxis protein